MQLFLPLQTALKLMLQSKLTRVYGCGGALTLCCCPSGVLVFPKISRTPEFGLGDVQFWLPIC